MTMYPDSTYDPRMRAAAERLRGRTVVAKFGGAAIDGADGANEALDAFAGDVALLASCGVAVIVVHGGGADITAMAARLGIETKFVDGRRVTDAAMLDVATMVLAGRINKDLARRITLAGCGALGLCGLDNALVTARRGASPDLGLVGDVEAVNAPFLRGLLGAGLVPVLAPIGMGIDGEACNINADAVAGAVAAAVGADTVLFMSNVEGIACNGETIARLDESGARELIAAGAVTGGMIPKVGSALAALDAGAASVRIVDGRPRHALLLALMNPASGTAVTRAQRSRYRSSQGRSMPAHAFIHTHTVKGVLP